MSIFDFDILKIIKNIFFRPEKSQHPQITIYNNHGSIITNNISKDISRKREDNLNNIISKTTQTDYKRYPGPEWFGPFIEYAKDISEEYLQKMWSDILVGKMNNKDTSIRTMSTLSQINSSEARLFYKLLKYNISGRIYYEEGQMPKDFPSFDEISILFEAGLLKQVNDVAMCIKNQVSTPTTGIIGFYYGYKLSVDFPHQKTEIKIPAIFLSKAGQELSRFVQHSIDEEYLFCLSRFLKTRGNYHLQKINEKDTFQFIPPHDEICRPDRHVKVNSKKEYNELEHISPNVAYYST